MKRICVYCGSGAGRNPAYMAAARALGGAMAAAGIGLVYGGGSLGLMGETARAVLEGGGEVTGIIPEFLGTKERMLADITELVVVKNMHERKMLMFDRSDGFAEWNARNGPVGDRCGFSRRGWRTHAGRFQLCVSPRACRAHAKSPSYRTKAEASMAWSSSCARADKPSDIARSPAACGANASASVSAPRTTRATAARAGSESRPKSCSSVSNVQSGPRCSKGAPGKS